MASSFKNKKIVRNLLVLVVILIVLIAAVFALKFIPKSEVEENVTPQTDYSTIFECDYEQIVRVDINNEYGNLVFNKSNENWICESAPEVEIGEYQILGLIIDFGTVAGTLIDENPQDYSVYGLDTAKATISIKLIDGTQKKFLLGNNTASNSGYYLKTDDSDAVYVIAGYKGDNFFKKLFDFRNTNVYKAESENTYAVTVRNKNGEFKIQKSDSVSDDGGTTFLTSNWQIVFPDKLVCDDEKIEEVLFNQINFETTDFIEDNSSKYEQYGLNSPVLELTYEDLSGEATTLSFGKMSGGEIFVKKSGADWIYKVSALDLDALDIKYLDIASTTTMLENIQNVESVYVSFNKQDHIMMIDRTGDEEVYSVDDKKVDESAFKDLYRAIIGITIDGEISESGTGTHICSVTFNYVDGSPSKTIDYYTYSDRFASIVLNGDVKYYTSRQKVQDIIDLLTDIIK